MSISTIPVGPQRSDELDELGLPGDRRNHERDPSAEPSRDPTRACGRKQSLELDDRPRKLGTRHTTTTRSAQDGANRIGMSRTLGASVVDIGRLSWPCLKGHRLGSKP